MAFEDDARFVRRTASPERPRSPRIYERSRSYQRSPIFRPFGRPVGQNDTRYSRSNRLRNAQSPVRRPSNFGQQSRLQMQQRGGRNPQGPRAGPRYNKCGRAAHTNLMYCPANQLLIKSVRTAANLDTLEQSAELLIEIDGVRRVNPVSTSRGASINDHVRACKQRLTLITMCRNIVLKIKGKPIQCIVDTGSVSTIISRTFAKKLGLDIKPCVNNSPLFSANGAPLSVVGVADVTFYLKGLRVPHTLKVVDGLTPNLVIGIDFMKANKVSVNYVDGTVRFYEDFMIVPLQGYDSRDNCAFVSQTVCIPKYAEAVILVTVAKQYANTCVVLESLYSRYDLVALAGSVNNAEGRRAMVKVSNYKPHSVVLTKHTKIASVVPQIQLQRYSNLKRLKRTMVKHLYKSKNNRPMFCKSLRKLTNLI